MEIPSSILQKQEQLKALEKTKKLYEQITSQNNRLITCRQHRTAQSTNVRDLQAVQHFEFLKRQQDEALEKLETQFEIYKQQIENSRQRLTGKKLYVEEKLEKARARVESQKTAKGKEELNLEKQLQELIAKWKEARQGAGQDLQNAVYGLKDVPVIEKQITEESPQPTPSSETPPIPPTPPPVPPPPEPPKPKIKRKAKVVEDVSEEEMKTRLEEYKKEVAAMPPPPLPTFVEEKPSTVKEDSEGDSEEEEIKEPLKDDHPASKLTEKQIKRMTQEELFKLLRPDVTFTQNKILSVTKQKR